MHAAFKSTTRDAWAKAHASKTNPPEVARYTPKYEALDANKRMVAVPEEHKHEGLRRIHEKTLQQTHICLKQIKALNYPVHHEKSQAERLAQQNKKKLDFIAEQERLAKEEEKAQNN